MLNMAVRKATARFLKVKSYYINISILGKIYQYIPFYQLKGQGMTRQGIEGS
jgi:hypothetical protein